MNSKEESVGKLPVFVFPETLNFFSDNQSSHKQVLTLYNPYEFTLQFRVLCNNPTKYNVVESEGVIKQKCCVDIVVRATDILSAAKREDKFRIHLYQYGFEKLLGKKDIMAVLQCSESKEPTIQVEKRSNMYEMSKTLERRRDSVIIQRSLPSLPVMLITFASLIVLMLPTYGDRVTNNNIPDYLFMSINQKLIAAYILGNNNFSKGKMSTWMSDLPSQISNKIPFNQLAIPGSHDAGAFYLDPKSPICPDESKGIKVMGKIFKSTLIGWSVTQRYPIEYQLSLGVRYFDMRIGYLTDKDDFFFVHGCYGFQMFSLLQVIADFTKNYPKEVVVVDLQEFHEFTPKLHETFSRHVEEIFKGKLYPYSGNGASSTLKEIWDSGKQIIVRYNYPYSEKSYPEFWPANALYSPWRDTSSPGKLIRFLNKRLTFYSAKQLSVFQAILSPQTDDILKGLLCCCYPHQLSELDEKSKEFIQSWLDQVYASRRIGVNIFMCDFIANDGCIQCILRLNELHALN